MMAVEEKVGEVLLAPFPTKVILVRKGTESHTTPWTNENGEKSQKAPGPVGS